MRSAHANQVHSRCESDLVEVSIDHDPGFVEGVVPRPEVFAPAPEPGEEVLPKCVPEALMM